jgi:outer membrane protein assembly factor BamB
MWREFRADCAKTGNLPIRAPENFQVKWEKDLDPNTVIDEPVVGVEGEIIFTLSDGTVIALDNKGEQLWTINSMQGATGPAISEDGTIYVPQIGRINAISTKGKVSWTLDIKGKPTPASIFPKSQAIALGAYSADWIGTYIIGSDGTKISDSMVKNAFSMEQHGRGALITPPALSSNSQNTYVATRTFDTHTWREEDGPEPEHYYESIALNQEGKIFWQEKSSTFSLWGECGTSVSPFPHDPALETILFLLDHAIYVYHVQSNTFTPILNSFDLFAEDVPESVALGEMVPFQSDLCILDNPAYDPKSGSFVYRVAKKVDQAPTEETKFPPREIHDLPCFINVNWVNQTQGKKAFTVDLWYQPYTSPPATDKAGTIFMGIPGGLAVITADGEKNDVILTSTRDPVDKVILCSEDSIVCVTRSGKLLFAAEKK